MTEIDGIYAEERVQRQNLLHQLVALGFQNVAHSHRTRVDAIARGIVHGRRRWRSVGVGRCCSCIGFHVIQSRCNILNANAELNLLNLLDADDSRGNRNTQSCMS